MSQIKVTIWNENRHEQNLNSLPAKIYPEGIHGAIKSQLEGELGTQISVTTATLDEPNHGLTREVIAKTDVLLWWGHEAHSEVSDQVVDSIYEAVNSGMGLIVGITLVNDDYPSNSRTKVTVRATLATPPIAAEGLGRASERKESKVRIQRESKVPVPWVSAKVCKKGSGSTVPFLKFK